MSIRVKKRDYLTISIVLIVVSVCGLVFSIFLFAASVEQVLKWTIPLKPGAISRTFFLELPFPLEFNCHVFSVENPKEVQNGAKPILKDIGPYVFHEHILKHDTEDDEENDTLTYTLKKTWIFKPELSNGLTGDENITILHPVINALALTVNVDRKVFLKLAAGVIVKMYKPTTPFWTGRAMDLFFDGLEIDCTHTSFAVKTVCSIMGSGEISAIRPMPEKKNFFKFSLLGPYNDSFNGRFTVMRGKKNIHDVARLVEIDGKKQMNTWHTDDANQYKGTDGYFMPPLLNINEPIFAFERMKCVSLGLEYERKQSFRGFPLPTFTKNLKDFAADKAYCRKHGQMGKAKSVNGSCPVEGTLDLFNCMGVPIVATLPHFLDADPSLLANIESGLEPKKKDHELVASVDLETGVPILAVKRLQFNFDVIPIKEVKVMKKLRNMLFPLAWIEERVALPGLYVTGMQFLFFTRLGVTATKYLCMSLIPLIAVASLVVHCLISYDKIQVIESSPTSSVQSLTGSVKSKTSSMSSKTTSVKSSTSTEKSPTGSVNITEETIERVSNHASESRIPSPNFQFVN